LQSGLFRCSLAWALAGMIGVWLFGIEGIGAGIIVGGFAYSCWDLWRNWQFRALAER
jgi:hypothetical protein